MAYSIVWTELATEKFNEVIIYLEENWNQKIIQEFIFTVDDFLDLVVVFPMMGVEEKKTKNIRSFVISKFHTIFYKLDSFEIIILDVFDNRSNPENKPT